MSWIDPISSCAGRVQHIVGKLSTRATSFLYTSLQSEVCMWNMCPQSCESPSCENFGTPTWESQDKMPFRCGPPWKATKNTIRGKVVASPKSEPWWVLWVWCCLRLVLTPKMFEPCTNQLFVCFVQIHVTDWTLVNLPSPISELQHVPLPPKCYEPRSAPWFLALPLLSL
jgi:hypothetical protein